MVPVLLTVMVWSLNKMKTFYFSYPHIILCLSQVSVLVTPDLVLWKLRDSHLRLLISDENLDSPLWISNCIRHPEMLITLRTRYFPIHYIHLTCWKTQLHLILIAYEVHNSSRKARYPQQFTPSNVFNAHQYYFLTASFAKWLKGKLYKSAEGEMVEKQFQLSSKL